MSDELDEQVNRLLHDAEHALGGADFARMMVGRIASAAQDATSLDAKASALIAKALVLDPARACPAWQECEPRVAKLSQVLAPSRAEERGAR